MSAKKQGFENQDRRMILWLASVVIGPLVPWQAGEIWNALTEQKISTDSCVIVFLPVWALVIFAASVWWVKAWTPKEGRDAIAVGVTLGAFSFLASLLFGATYVYVAVSRSGGWQ
jgi:ABC-type sulfate transport system permease component